MATERTLMLKILSPEKVLFSGQVAKVLLPGGKEPFMVLFNHAPLMSTLQEGVIKWSGAAEGNLAVTGGFVEVKDNVVIACVETDKNYE